MTSDELTAALAFAGQEPTPAYDPLKYGLSSFAMPLPMLVTKKGILRASISGLTCSAQLGLAAPPSTMRMGDLADSRALMISATALASASGTPGGSTLARGVLRYSSETLE